MNEEISTISDKCPYCGKLIDITENKVEHWINKFCINCGYMFFAKEARDTNDNVIKVVGKGGRLLPQLKTESNPSPFGCLWILKNDKEGMQYHSLKTKDEFLQAKAKIDRDMNIIDASISYFDTDQEEIVCHDIK